MSSADNLAMTIDRITASIDRVEQQHLNEAAEFIQGAAIELAPVRDGELRQSIKARTYKDDDGANIAEVYTRKEYAPYVEFGTGPKGQAEHFGVSPEVEITYAPGPWWIHESMLDPGAIKAYNWFSINTENGRFYKSYGQYAQPFLYPAMHDHKKDILDILGGGYEEVIKGAVK